MTTPSASISTSNEQVYGFLCPTTNVFYAFESYETYQQFLQWLASQGTQPQVDDARALETRELPMVNEADQLEDF